MLVTAAPLDRAVNSCCAFRFAEQTTGPAFSESPAYFRGGEPASDLAASSTHE